MRYWLIKTEPSTWSWQDQVLHKTTWWDGVRNYQATNTPKSMTIGDLCFFYHSVTERQIIGIVEVTRSYQPDPSDAKGRFGMVEIKAVKPLITPVTLAAIKAEPRLASLALLRQPRLSVMSVNEAAWSLLLEMGNCQ